MRRGISLNGVLVAVISRPVSMARSHALASLAKRLAASSLLRFSDK